MTNVQETIIATITYTGGMATGIMICWNVNYQRIKYYKQAIRDILYQGHNEDCIHCGFKDKIATQALNEKDYRNEHKTINTN